MAYLKEYNLAGEEVGKIEIDDELLNPAANTQMIKDYVTALRANARQWSANTKTRAEVNHSGKKPHPQKGTGRARQGYLGAPQYKGGGRVHAPRPKFDQHVKVNKKEKRAVIRQLLIEKVLNDSLHVLQFVEMDKPQTKQVAQFLKARDLENKKIIFLAESGDEGQGAILLEKYHVLYLSSRNIFGLRFLPLTVVNGYDVIANQHLIVMNSAVDQLKVLLGGQS